MKVETVQIFISKDGYGADIFTSVIYELIHSDPQRLLNAFYLHNSMSFSIGEKKNALKTASSRLILDSIDSPVDYIGRLIHMEKLVVHTKLWHDHLIY